MLRALPLWRGLKVRRFFADILPASFSALPPSANGSCCGVSSRFRVRFSLWPRGSSPCPPCFAFSALRLCPPSLGAISRPIISEPLVFSSASFTSFTSFTSFAS